MGPQEKIQTPPPVKRPLPKLTTSSIAIFDCSINEKIKYAKETQTADIQVESDTAEEENEKVPDVPEPEETNEQSEENHEPLPPKKKELTQDECEMIEKSDKFWDFI